MDFFFLSGQLSCEAECGSDFVHDDPKGIPVLFEVECEEHGNRQVAFHESCLPPEYAEAYRQIKMRKAAPLN